MNDNLIFKETIETKLQIFDNINFSNIIDNNMLEACLNSISDNIYYLLDFVKTSKLCKDYFMLILRSKVINFIKLILSINSNDKLNILAYVLNYFLSLSFKLLSIYNIETEKVIYFIEDVFDMSPVYLISSLFNNLANNYLKNKSYKDFTPTDSLLIVKTANGILNRLSPSLDTSLRGEIQSLISQLFSIYHLSGVNARGQYNVKNQNYDILAKFDNCNSITFNFETVFYKNFWTLHKYICNPMLIFNTDINQVDAIDGIEDFEFDKDSYSCSSDNNINLMQLESNKKNNITNNDINFDSNNNNILSIYLKNLSNLVNFFFKNSVNIQSLKVLKSINIKKEAVFSYPKFLISPQLFELQINDPSFRIIIVSQIIINLKALIKPINSIQKNCFIISSEKHEAIKVIINKCYEYLDIIYNEYYEILKHNMNDEVYFENWKINIGKENLNKQIINNNQLKDKINLLNTKYESQQNYNLNNLAYNFKKIDINADKIIYNKKSFNIDYKSFSNSKSNILYNVYNSEDDIYSKNAYVGKFIDKLVEEERDNDNAIDIEDKYKTNSLYCFKTLKLITYFDMGRLEKFKNINIDYLIKEYKLHYEINSKLSDKNRNNIEMDQINTENNKVNTVIEDICIINENYDNNFNNIISKEDKVPEYLTDIQYKGEINIKNKSIISNTLCNKSNSNKLDNNVITNNEVENKIHNEDYDLKDKKKDENNNNSNTDLNNLNINSDVNNMPTEYNSKENNTSNNCTNLEIDLSNMANKSNLKKHASIKPVLINNDNTKEENSFKQEHINNSEGTIKQEFAYHKRDSKSKIEYNKEKKESVYTNNKKSEVKHDNTNTNSSNNNLKIKQNNYINNYSEKYKSNKFNNKTDSNYYNDNNYNNNKNYKDSSKEHSYINKKRHYDKDIGGNKKTNNKKVNY